MRLLLRSPETASVAEANQHKQTALLPLVPPRRTAAEVRKHPIKKLAGPANVLRVSRGGQVSDLGHRAGAVRQPIKTQLAADLEE